jgi:hypothetical protein
MNGHKPNIRISAQFESDLYPVPPTDHYSDQTPHHCIITFNGLTTTTPVSTISEPTKPRIASNLEDLIFDQVSTQYPNDSFNINVYIWPDNGIFLVATNTTDPNKPQYFDVPEAGTIQFVSESTYRRING